MKADIAIFVIFSIVSLSLADDDLRSPKIVNGTDANIVEFPFLVSLRFNNSHQCAGSLLNDVWIVTAAHCLFDRVEFLTVQYGETVISNTSTNVREAELYIQHEEWDSRAIRNDIGLIKLKQPLDTGFQGSPVRIASPGRFYLTGTPTTAAGWGRIGTGMPLSPILQKVDLQIYNYPDCRDAHSVSGSGLNVYRSNICAGVPEMGKAECNGDSGGPLMVNGVQVGIVSWSLKPCAVAPYPGVYTDIGFYISWISEHTGIKFDLDTFFIRKL